MSETGTPNASPEANQPKSSRGWRWAKRGVAVLLLLGVGAASGAAIGAKAVKAQFWRGIDNAQSMSTEEISKRVDRRVERALSRVDGTPEQKQQISAIATAAITDLRAMDFAPREIRGQVIALMSADNFDAAALEALRAEQVTKLDMASRRMVQAVSDAASVLTVEQRKEFAEMMSKRGWRRGHQGQEGGNN